MASLGLENLTGVLAFVRAAEVRSFTGAARVLGITPSGVSKAISRLEAHFGVRLLQRTSRSVTLTTEGAAFYDRCRQIVADLQTAEQSLSAAREAPRGRLRVTMPVALGRGHIARLLPGFLHRHPEVTIEANATDRIVDLAEEGFDVALRLGRPPDSRLVARRLIGGTQVTCASPAYLAARGEPATPEALAEHDCTRFVVPSSGVVREWVFRRDGVTFEVPVTGRLTFNQSECLVEAACAGAGIIQISSYVTGQAIAQGRLLPILTGFAVESPELWALYPQNRHATPRVRAFVDYLVETAREGRLGAMPADGVPDADAVTVPAP